MEYSIKKLAELAGVTTRTLRYYDEIGLLKPARISPSGYRMYGEKEVDLLQQILFYRTMDMKLEEIEKIIYDPEFNRMTALEGHLKELHQKVKELTAVIQTVEKTIAYQKGEINMTNKEKFEGIKKEAVSENEKKYGKEIREKYGEEVVEESNQKYLNLSEQEMEEMQQTEEEMLHLLSEVRNTKEINSKEAKRVAELHKKWLGYTWNFYSPEAHKGLGLMYVADERFTKYYDDRAGEGSAQLLNEILQKYI